MRCMLQRTAGAQPRRAVEGTAANGWPQKHARIRPTPDENAQWRRREPRLQSCASCADSCDSAIPGKTGTHGNAVQHTAGTVLATRVAARGDNGITCQRGDACQAHVAPDAFFRSIDPHFEFFDAMVPDPSYVKVKVDPPSCADAFAKQLEGSAMSLSMFSTPVSASKVYASPGQFTTMFAIVMSLK